MPLENNMSTSASFCLILTLLSTLSSASNGRDTVTQSQSIKDGETLVSAGGIYVLGFFTPGDSKNRYVGIWFAVSPEAIVWVANRDRPLNDYTGILGLDTTGNLVLTDKTNKPFWSSLLPEAGSTVAQLLDSGNLVVRDVSSGNTDVFLWQSFEYPSDTMLAGMKLGPDYRAGRDRTLTSWRNASDPSPGEFTFRLVPRGLGQPFLWDHQLQPVFRSGPWNGLRFSGTPEMASYDMFNFTVVEDQEESYYQFGITKPGTLARLVVNQSGQVQRLVWIEGTATWDAYSFNPKDPCDNYARCGPYGLCDVNTYPVCACLPGFQPKNTSDWSQRNWNGGCVRKTKLNCSDADGFLLLPQVKLPDTVNSTVNVGMSLGQCREVCLKNCSCTAYARANISVGGSGCVIWFGDLVDIRDFTSNGQDLYLRLAASEHDSMTSDSHKKKKVAIIVTLCTVLVGLLLLVACGCFIWNKNRVKLIAIEEGTNQQYVIKCHGGDDHELLVFDFATIAAATNIFSNKNMIGKGGFGIVYMGKLDDGREVAVKRLSLHSGQGVDEFKTEVMLIAKLQHRNLVRLLGYCVEGEERMLIYEYMPNKSLDDFLFGDKRKRILLDWRKRLDIIVGIARGLLYLHQDSRLRIIHRDLKAGNILLDGSMNPKISDFGTARIFGRDQMEETTSRIVGTIGYMSPEYAMDGHFSEKSDVFSFGVLVLEIISGRKNRWISQKHAKFNLLAHAWSVWIENRCLELMDDILWCPCPSSEVSKCVQVGLLCLQESPDERPTMQQVVLALASDNPALPQPDKPGFFKSRDPTATDWPSSRQESISVNKITLTNLEGR